MDITEPSVLATGQSTTMPASEYSEDQIFHDTESDEESLYDFEVILMLRFTTETKNFYFPKDCPSESESLLGHNKARSAPNIATTTAVSMTTAVATKAPKVAHNFQLKMLDETLSIGVNQISPTSESVTTEQFEDARSLQSPGSFFSTSPPEGGASPARFHPVSSSPDRRNLPLPPQDRMAASRCIALYNFTAENPDEINMVNQEEVELLGDGDDEGWARVKNYKGRYFYITLWLVKSISPI